ncbi:MAG: SlyX family protein [Pseudomonadota bacterium]
METDIQSLQQKYMELAKTVDELNAVVARQDKEIMRLVSICSGLKSQLNAIDPGHTGGVQLGDERPPHY